MIIFRLIGESFRFAWNALRANVLRTLLSLLGVTIGIFIIIGVFTVVDSLERSINQSLSFLGRTNLDVRRFPFEFGNIPWWDYIKRPYCSYEEYEFLRDRLENAEGITIFSFANIAPQFESNNSYDISLLGISYNHNKVYEFKDINGRYFTEQECIAGRNVAIIGHRTKKELFPKGRNPLGKYIKIKGQKYAVIGVMPEEGEGLFGNTSNDENIYIPYKAFTKIVYTGKNGAESIISAKGTTEDIGLTELEFEMAGLLRKIRGLKPKQKDNFSLVRQQAILNSIGSFFDVLSVGGWVIGGFSILIGGFGIANIMFVSVRERTNIIGIQKSLGAKNFFILFQFMFESVFLCVIGASIGLLLVYFLSFAPLGNLDLKLTFANVVLGVGVATTIGIAAGIIPAILASRLDPVIAIRS